MLFSFLAAFDNSRLSNIYPNKLFRVRTNLSSSNQVMSRIKKPTFETLGVSEYKVVFLMIILGEDQRNHT